MSGSNFIDEIDITIRSGDGGSGCVHFRKEKYISKGGPDGGDGGNGGSVIFLCDSNLSTLYHLRRKHHYFAGNGENGSEKNKHGHAAENLYIPVPLGTRVIDKQTSTLMCELLSPDQTFVALKGGRGGLGNTHFKSSTNQSPMYAQEGEKGLAKDVHLELCLLADVGLVGFPNAGKSTFLSVISAARPLIGDYEFTTLIPQLGVVSYKNKNIVVADLPGIIKNAHIGKGLGLHFLKHLRHVNCLCYVLAIDNDPISRFLDLQKEVFLFDSNLLKLKYIVVVSKVDIVGTETRNNVKKKFQGINVNPFFISSFTREGVNEVLDKIICN